MINILYIKYIINKLLNKKKKVFKLFKILIIYKLLFIL